MEEILAMASRLGKMISQTDRFEALRKAEKDALADKDAQTALKELQEMENRIAEKEKAGQPIEVEEKHRLAELQERVRENDTLWKLAQAQADYMELLNRVNQSVHQHLKLDRNKEKED